jgi:hypothetical protein
VDCLGDHSPVARNVVPRARSPTEYAASPSSHPAPTAAAGGPNVVPTQPRNSSRPWPTAMIACNAAESSADSPKPSRGSSRYSPVGKPGVIIGQVSTPKGEFTFGGRVAATVQSVALEVAVVARSGHLLSQSMVYTLGRRVPGRA